MGATKTSTKNLTTPLESSPVRHCRSQYLLLKSFYLLPLIIDVIHGPIVSWALTRTERCFAPAIVPA